MADALLSAPPVLIATHSYWPAFSASICQMVSREPSGMSFIAYCPLLDPELTSRPFHRQFIRGRGVPRATQSIDTSDPESTSKLSPISMATFAIPSIDSIELFPDWIWALLSPSKEKFELKFESEWWKILVFFTRLRSWDNSSYDELLFTSYFPLTEALDKQLTIQISDNIQVWLPFRWLVRSPR